MAEICNQPVTHFNTSAGGDAEMFKEINTAYEVLRDPEKRKLYDEVYIV